ncbi:MAG: hypothetical protein LLG02_04290 [Pelosinus sp.]|nr:hypothetical protein [Pelosinus sp.]
MFSKYFGIFLLSKGLLTKQQFFDITQANTGTTNSIDDISKISTFSEDFQEIYEDAVSAQQITSAILSKNILSFEQMQQAINEFEKECQLIEDQATGFKGLNYEIIVRILLDSSIITNKKLRDIFYIYIAILLTNIAKYLDDEPAIWTNYPLKERLPQIPADKAWMISQQLIIKDVQINVRLLMHVDLLLALARRYSQETITAVNSLALDAAGEFFSFNNGLLITNLTNAGISAEIGLPKVVQEFPAASENGYIVPIGLQEGQMYLLFTID